MTVLLASAINKTMSISNRISIMAQIVKILHEIRENKLIHTNLHIDSFSYDRKAKKVILLDDGQCLQKEGDICNVHEVGHRKIGYASFILVHGDSMFYKPMKEGILIHPYSTRDPPIWPGPGWVAKANTGLFVADHRLHTYFLACALFFVMTGERLDIDGLLDTAMLTMPYNMLKSFEELIGPVRRRAAYILYRMPDARHHTHKIDDFCSMNWLVHAVDHFTRAPVVPSSLIPFNGHIYEQA